VLSGALARYRIVHFATHGILDTAHPELSGLALSGVDRQGRPVAGFLGAHEIYRLRLPADVVVLSGCETALGREIRGEGLVGLTRAFLHAGARRVVVSLWPVQDQATAELMRRFYLGMLHRHLPPAAALRAAQAGLRDEPAWRDPYFWAGFVLQGDWR
jgi:CHAT domain-containing protein